MLRNIKNYAMALGALAIAATSGTLMSFGKKEALSPQWYTVAPADPITGKHLIGSPMGGNPDEVNCRTDAVLDEICAVKFEGTAPTYVEDLADNAIPHDLAYSEED